ncbi:MAG: D-alanyl-D-alanine carboxypeptidase [Actinomycetota bacterium]|nr:D-alanyl-D-alanine carboxypeptidase [Actinomycetota bacterium]
MRKIRTLAAVATAVAVVTSPIPQASASDKSPRRSNVDHARLQSLADKIVSAGVPGVYVEVRNGAKVETVVSGVADRTTKRAVSATFDHRIGSVTKTLVAATTLRLVQEGRLALDAPVNRYLPNVLPTGEGDKITVRMLLNHTSGLGEYIDTQITTLAGLERLRNRPFAPEEIVTETLKMPRTGTPGSRFFYSNTNYHLVGMVISQVTGRPYAQEVDRLVLHPLGMTRTYFPGTSPLLRGPHAAGYYKTPDGTWIDWTVSHHSYAGAAGEAVSTLQDVNGFYRALLGGKLLSPAMFKEMTTLVPNPDDPSENVGLGIVRMAKSPSCPLWGHGGAAYGYMTFSLHSANGHRQMTFGINRLLYGAPGPDDLAIAEAEADLVEDVMCR